LVNTCDSKNQKTPKPFPFNSQSSFGENCQKTTSFMIVNKIDTFAGHRDAVYTLVQSEQDSVFYSAAGDGLVVAWDLKTPDLGQPLAQIQASVYAMALAPDSQHLWVGQNHDGIHIIDPIAKKNIYSIQLTGAAIFDIQFYGNRAFVAVGDGTIIVIDTLSLGVLKHIKASDQSARCMAVNPQTKEIAVGYSDHHIRIFDLETYQMRYTFKAHLNSVFTLKYSPDYRFLISGSRDAHLKSWNVWDNYISEKQVVAHVYAINHIEFSPDKKYLATASMDKSIKIWDAQHLQLLKVIDRGRHAGHGTSVNRLLWMPHEATLISASDDRRISVWQIQEE
jgi:WD40 repeat protein